MRRMVLSATVLVAALAPASGQSRYSNKLAPYVASPQRVVEKMLDMAGVKSGETVYDLGCGDGRVLFTAVEKFRAKAVGVEIDPKLVASTRETAEKMQLGNRVKIVQGNLLEADLTEADVVTLYLLTESNQMLRPRLEKMLHAGARVVSYDYAVPGWKAKWVERVEDNSRSSHDHVIYLYEMPPQKEPKAPASSTKQDSIKQDEE
jgi:SAM-dependent methyltransferase